MLQTLNGLFLNLKDLLSTVYVIAFFSPVKIIQLK